MLFSFVILHYKTVSDTIRCIESILSIEKPCRIDIIVVDNNSANGSFEELEKRYGQTREVRLIHNEKNLGFARGNNVGFEAAKKSGADYIAVLNNDIIIESKDIIFQVIKCDSIYGFSILGPDIVSAIDGSHQNPMETTTTDIREIKRRILRYMALLMLNEISLYDKIKRKRNLARKEKNPVNKNSNYIRDCQLHGAFIVFGSNFIINEKYAFCPETFLYTEEPILFQYCMRKGYHSLYSPDICVLHKEDSSTNSQYNVEKDKRAFVFSNLIKSHRIYLRHMKNRIDKW